MSSKNQDRKQCKMGIDPVQGSTYRERLPDIIDDVLSSSTDDASFNHIGEEPIPSTEAVIDIIARFREVLFPGYFSRERIDAVNLKYSMGRCISVLYNLLEEQICLSFRHNCFRYDKGCVDCDELGHKIALTMIQSIPGLQKTLANDVRAAYDGDPAAQSYDEIVFSYPGLFAIRVYRIAHLLYENDVPFIPRIMTEYAHSLTGIDIHPGAKIGAHFFIDHGTGVVIGETTVIGDHVRIYQGVTLGALSLPVDAGERMRDRVKRHPTIEDNVIIYSGATILGGDTVIGSNSVIGGNVWITKSIPPDTKVILETPKLVYK